MKKEHMLVVGGSKGTGRAVVQAAVKEGYVVSVISREKPQKRHKGVSYWAADITKQESLPEVLKKLVCKNGKLNHLVFCHQFRGVGDEWNGQIDTGLTATRAIIELVSGLFQKKTGNSITMISSIASRLVAKEKSVGYHVVKAGLEQMIRYYALVLGPRGIRVNGISPNAILKEENKGFYHRNKELYGLYKKISPLGRMVTSDDVANGVLLLCGPCSSAITGQSIVVDCGVSLQEHAGLARALKSLGKLRITQTNNEGSAYRKSNE